jgi:hypothetical protein
METVSPLPNGGATPFVNPVWVFLKRRLFAAKTLDFGGWICLDFLGFSRQDLDLSMGYTRFPADNFSSRFWRRETAVETAAPRFGMRKGRIVHGASLLQFLIFCKRLPLGSFPSDRLRPKAIALNV